MIHEEEKERHDLIGRRVGRWTVVRTKRRVTDGRNVFILSDGEIEIGLRGYKLVKLIAQAKRDGVYVSGSPSDRDVR